MYIGRVSKTPVKESIPLFASFKTFTGFHSVLAGPQWCSKEDLNIDMYYENIVYLLFRQLDCCVQGFKWWKLIAACFAGVSIYIYIYICVSIYENRSSTKIFYHQLFLFWKEFIKVVTSFKHLELWEIRTLQPRNTYQIQPTQTAWRFKITDMWLHRRDFLHKKWPNKTIVLVVNLNKWSCPEK